MCLPHDSGFCTAVEQRQLNASALNLLRVTLPHTLVSSQFPLKDYLDRKGFFLF